MLYMRSVRKRSLSAPGSGAQRQRLTGGGAWCARWRRDRMYMLSHDCMYMYAVHSCTRTGLRCGQNFRCVSQAHRFVSVSV